MRMFNMRFLLRESGNSLGELVGEQVEIRNWKSHFEAIESSLLCSASYIIFFSYYFLLEKLEKTYLWFLISMLFVLCIVYLLSFIKIFHFSRSFIPFSEIV